MSSSANTLRRIVLIASEAMWISLALSAIANTWPHFSMSVPFWALVLPGLVALAIATLASKINQGWKPRLVAAIVPNIVVLALFAGILANVSLPGSLWRSGFLPWSIGSGRSSSITTLAWFDVSLIVARSVQIALFKDNFARSIRSVVVACSVYFALFLAIATQHNTRLNQATKYVEPIFLAYFLFAIVLLRLSRADDLEISADRERSPASDVRWRLLLALPLIIVAAIALVISAALGSKSSALHHAILDFAHAIVWFFREIEHGFSYAVTHVALAIVDVISFFVNLIVGHHKEGAVTKVAKTTTTTLPAPTNHAPIGLTIALIAIFFIALAIALRWLLKNHKPAPLTPGHTGGDIRSSTFTWRGFFSQIITGLRLLFRSMLKKLRRRRADPGVLAAAKLAPDGVRREFQRVLREAMRIGIGRESTETAHEFATRIDQSFDAPGQQALSRLANAYDRVRYGHTDEEQGLDEEIALLLAELSLREKTTPSDPAQPGAEGVATT
jgi:hypothetical protein